MNEKEFLQAYSIFIGTCPNGTMRDDCIDLFLKEHHKEYFEVEFIKKDEEDNYDYAVDDMNFDAAREKRMFRK